MTVHEALSAEAGNPSTPQPQGGWMWPALTALLCAAASLAVLCGIAGRFQIIPDEHQFITPGILTLREGLLPYRDYPLFHVPYQPLLNAAFLQLTEGNLFLGCRIPGAIAGWLTAVLVGWQGFLWLRPRMPRLGLVIASSVMLTACITPVTLRACSYAWNHQWPTLLTIIAVLSVLRLERRNSWLLALIGGAAIGGAAGMRISYLPMLAPLGLAVLLLPGRTWPARVRTAAGFSAGVIVALLPCLWLFAKAPEHFVFGNFEYPKLSVPRKQLPFWSEKTAKTVDPVRGYVGDPKIFKAKNISGRMGHARRQFVYPNAGIVGLALILGLSGAVWAVWRQPDYRYCAMVLLGGLPFLIWGCLAPSRFHEQYWYAPIPWLALLTLFGLSRLPSSPRWRTASIALVLVALMGTAFSAVTYGELFAVRNGGFFEVSPILLPSKRHAEMPSPVLTLQPTSLLTAGVPIYPELSSGEFGWRSSHLLPKDRRQRLHLLSPFDLDEVLATRPPGAIVIWDPDDKLEEPLIQWAEKNGYRKGRDPGVYTPPVRAESPQP